MIRLTQICLIVFLGTLAAYLYQLHEHKDYTLSFLIMGAAGCLYMLMRMERHYTQLSHRRTQAIKVAGERPKRVTPKIVAAAPLVERKPIPVISRAHEGQANRCSVSVK